MSTEINPSLYCLAHSLSTWQHRCPQRRGTDAQSPGPAARLPGSSTGFLPQDRSSTLHPPSPAWRKQDSGFLANCRAAGKFSPKRSKSALVSTDLPAWKPSSPYTALLALPQSSDIQLWVYRAPTEQEVAAGASTSGHLLPRPSQLCPGSQAGHNQL